ncbi:tryptophan halogenase family protein [Gilvimarinus agarilyticus]|uniref:tryptophan halogenase family protein n=1 Tax=Gilvimarinus agarilyticus TaxID=679259 RepID=UPI0006969A0D|nr:tryptophan halogenase family protein [Gilvimarinus agarilyticus]
MTQRIVIVGGGTAGWMTAAAFARLLPAGMSITLVESDNISTVGVGEATIPHIRYFNQLLGIAEREFIQATQATYKLAIEFVGWGDESSRYMHPFSAFGHDLGGIDFHHHWLCARAALPHLRLDSFSLAAQLAHNGRFAPPPPYADLGYGYAFHVDATRYAILLRRYAEKRRVVRCEGTVDYAEQSADGRLSAVVLESGARIEGDFFVDCSGFRSLLLGQAMKVPFTSWKHWLPCDRAIAMASEPLKTIPSFTRSTATGSGWQWRIPLQERTGNGQVYASDYLTDDEAFEQLYQALNSEPVSEPNLLRFEAGCRAQSWKKNCVAVGLSSGFLEPLESTSIYLIQMAIIKCVEYFPINGEHSLSESAFNQWMSTEYHRVRDFLILHYHLNRRTDSRFWQDCAAMSIPDSLQQKIELFRESACIEQYERGLFAQPSWLAVYLGQGLLPTGFDSRALQSPQAATAAKLDSMASHLQQLAQRAPMHGDVIRRGGLSQEGPAVMSLYGERRG